MARNGFPPLLTIVGVSVVLGRLPPARTLGLDGSRWNACMRLLIGTPVLPAKKAPPRIQPELGVAENRLPSASATWSDVVSPCSFWSSVSVSFAFPFRLKAEARAMSWLPPSRGVAPDNSAVRVTDYAAA